MVDMAVLVPPVAVLWDFDGTLVDTEKYWVDAEFAILAEYGVPWSQAQGKALAGSSWQESTGQLLAQLRAHGVEPDVGPRELYRRMYRSVADRIRSDGLPWLPGARELLADVQAAQVPQALVSASPIAMLDVALDLIGRQVFAAVVDGTQLSRPKPDPQGYRLAADRLGVSASACIVLEDSVPGCAAGVLAGAVVLAVPNQVALPALPDQVIRHEGLDGLGWDDLRAIYRAVRPQHLNAAQQ